MDSEYSEVEELIDDIAEERDLDPDDVEYAVDKLLLFMLGKKVDAVGGSQ